MVLNVYFLYSYEHLWHHILFSNYDKEKATISKKTIVSWGRAWIKRLVIF